MSPSSSLESELAMVRQEKESLTQQLLNTIKHKVALSQELDAWQVTVCRDIKEFCRQTEYCFSIWTFDLVAGGHEVGNQSTGAAKGGGEKEGQTARERKHSRTSKKQIFKSEGRRRERFFLLLFQRQMTERSSSRVSAFIFCHHELMLWHQQVKYLQTSYFDIIVYMYVQYINNFSLWDFILKL